MPTTYKIHPGIGIARLGNSPDEFCLSPEEPAALPLDCDEDGNTLLSLCSMHAGHLRARQELERVPRNAPPAHKSEAMQAREFELARVVAPVVLARWANVTDPQSTAEMIFQHIQEIMRRLE